MFGNSFVTLLVAGYIFCLLGLFATFVWLMKRRRKPVPPPDDARATTMPAEYLKPEPRRLVQLLPGETAHVNWASVSVNERGAAFVQADEPLQDDPSLFTVKVHRKADGIVLTLRQEEGRRLTYTPRRLLHSVNYFPVIEILIEEEPRGRNP